MSKQLRQMSRYLEDELEELTKAKEHIEKQIEKNRTLQVQVMQQLLDTKE